MPRKRATLTPDKIGDFFAGPPGRRETPYDRKWTRKTYRVEQGQHSELAAIAEEHGIGLNELVRWSLGRTISEYNQGTLELPIEEYTVTKRILEAK